MKSPFFDISNKNIKKSIEKKELQLDFWQKAQHYVIALTLLYLSSLFPAILLILAIKNYFSIFPEPLKIEFLWASPFLGFAAIIYYFILKRRLKMTFIKTKLTREQIGDLTDNLGEHLNWYKEKNRKNLIVLKTPEDFWSFVAAEQITILFIENGILVNSIRNLDAQRKGFGEVGKNAENIMIIKSKVEKAEAKFLQ